MSRLSSYFLKNSVYLLYLASIDIKTPLSFPRYGFGMRLISIPAIHCTTYIPVSTDTVEIQSI